MRFIFVTDELPRPGSAGHLAVNHAIIVWLRNGGHEVTVFLTRPRFSWPVERYGIAAVIGPGIGSWREHVFANRPRGAMAILARNFLTALPVGPAAFLQRCARKRSYGTVDTIIGAFITPAQAAWCASRIRAMAPDAIIADTIFRAPLLNEPDLQHFRSVITAPDLFHKRHQAMSAAGYRIHPPKMTREMEAKLLSFGNAIAAIQPEEAAQISAMCPGQRVCITTLPALPCLPPTDQKKLPDRLVFVGSDTLPNIDGLRWFFAEVWPFLLKMSPGVTLDLVGDCGNTIGRLPHGVTRLGRVKNLSDILHRAMLAIAPMHVSSGLKIKILDYARHGLVTVATPESLYGFASHPDAPFLTAPDARTFAQTIATKLLHTETADRQKALDYVRRYYSAKTCFSGLADLLNIPAE